MDQRKAYLGGLVRVWRVDIGSIVPNNNWSQWGVDELTEQEADEEEDNKPSSDSSSNGSQVDEDENDILQELELLNLQVEGGGDLLDDYADVQDIGVVMTPQRKTQSAKKRRLIRT